MSDYKPNRYPLYTTVRTYAVFIDEDGAEYDPAALRFIYGKVVGDLIVAQTVLVYATDAALVRDSKGHYRCNFDPTDDGDWGYRYEDTALKTAKERRVVVEKSLFYT